MHAEYAKVHQLHEHGKNQIITLQAELVESEQRGIQKAEALQAELAAARSEISMSASAVNTQKSSSDENSTLRGELEQIALQLMIARTENANIVQEAQQAARDAEADAEAYEQALANIQSAHAAELAKHRELDSVR